VQNKGRIMEVSQDQNGITVENDRYLAKIDNGGRLLSLFDKASGKQVLSGAGNDVKFFLDGPSREDAWNIYENYKKREVKVFESCNVTVVENDDLGAVIRVHNMGQKVDFVQDIIFYHDKGRIDFKTTVDWQEENKVMRVYFPTTMNSPYFTSEVGFGAYSRPTVGNTRLDKSKFEVAAHRFTDISESNYGVALLNDSKYGHDVQYNTLGMTLLRSTGYPAKYPDKGIQQFTYSLLPHAESWDKAGVAHAGIELNAEAYMISAVSRRSLSGKELSGVNLPGESLLRCDNANIIIDTVKKEENGDGIVIRLYEANGSSGSAVLRFGPELSSAMESDLVEKKCRDIELEDNAIRFDFTPYEIKTFIVH